MILEEGKDVSEKEEIYNRLNGWRHCIWYVLENRCRDVLESPDELDDRD